MATKRFYLKNIYDIANDYLNKFSVNKQGQIKPNLSLGALFKDDFHYANKLSTTLEIAITVMNSDNHEDYLSQLIKKAHHGPKYKLKNIIELRQDMNPSAKDLEEGYNKSKNKLLKKLTKLTSKLSDQPSSSDAPRNDKMISLLTQINEFNEKLREFDDSLNIDNVSYSSSNEESSITRPNSSI